MLKVAEVDFDVHDYVACVRLNRPQVHNALSPEMIRELARIWKICTSDRSCRVAILSGAGPSFCSGMDLKRTDPGFGWRDVSEGPEASQTVAGERRFLNYIPGADCYKPIIGAVHGVAFGGGLELLLSCDIRYAAPSARFALPEVKRGLLPSSGAAFWLPRIIGYGAAMELLFTGREIDAEEALRLGLIDRIVTEEELLPAAQALAETIAANAPLAVQAVKEAARRSLGATLQEGLNISENLSRVLRFTEDYKEGALAFSEKRPSRFQGR